MKRFFLVMIFFSAAVLKGASTTGIDLKEIELCGACQAPYHVTAAVLDSPNVLISWLSADTGTFVVNYRLLMEDHTGWQTEQTRALHATLKYLLPCSRYLIRVDHVCSGTNILTSSETICFATAPCPPTLFPPSFLQTSMLTDSSAFCSWSSIGASSYTVRYKANSDSVYTLASTTSNNFYLSGLKKCTTYQISVQTVCGDGSVSEFGYPLYFTTTGCAISCFPPQFVTARVLDSTNVLVYWSSGQGDFTVNYRLASDTGAWTTIRTSDYSYYLTGLQKCKKYAVRIDRLCFDSAIPSSSPIVYFTSAGCASACSTPDSWASFINDSTTLLQWTNTQAASYKIRYRVSGDSSYTFLTSAQTYLYTNKFKSCGDYEFSVQSVCGAGKVSDFGAPFMFIYAPQYSGCAYCYEPGKIQAILKDSASIAVSWISTDSGSFVVNYRLANSSDAWTSVKTSGVGYLIRGLQKCKKYVIRADRICASPSAISMSATLVIETGGCQPYCDLPGFLGAGSGAGKANLFWEATSSDSYLVQYKTPESQVWTSAITTTNAYSLNGLIQCKNYSFRVKPICSTVSLEDLPVYSFLTGVCPKDTCIPPIYAYTNQVQDSVLISWVNIAPFPGQLTYQKLVEIRKASDSSRIFLDTIVPTGYQIKLPAGICGRYLARVRSICSPAWTDWVKFTVDGACFVPVGPKGVGGTPAAKFAKAYKLFPNPGTNRTQASYGLTETGAVRFEALNLQGQVVKTWNFGAQDAGEYEQTLDGLGDLPTGMYFISMRINNLLAGSLKWLKIE